MRELSNFEKQEHGRVVKELESLKTTVTSLTKDKDKLEKEVAKLQEEIIELKEQVRTDKFILSFIMEIYVAPLQGYYSEALLTLAWLKRIVFRLE